MRKLTTLACLALALMGLSSLQSYAWVDQMQDAQAQGYKVKVKDERVIVRDKSKPVRRALEAQYAKLAEANKNKDLAAVLALRTPDFSAKLPNGEIRNSAEMAEYSRILFQHMQAPI